MFKNNESPKGAPVSINSGASPGPKELGCTPLQATGYFDTNKPKSWVKKGSSLPVKQQPQQIIKKSDKTHPILQQMSQEEILKTLKQLLKKDDE